MCSSLLFALLPVTDLTLSHLLRATIPWETLNFINSQVTLILSDVQACHQTLRDHQEATCSSRSYYCAIWQAAGPEKRGDNPVPKGISSVQGNYLLYTYAPQDGEGEEIRRSGQKMAPVVPIPSHSSYLGEGLR